MARLDPLIETLLCEAGIELRLQSDATAQLALKAGVVSPIRKVLSTQQIRTFVAELASADVAPQVLSGATHLSFPYRHPKGTVLVDVQPDGDRILVRVVPGPVTPPSLQPQPPMLRRPRRLPASLRLLQGMRRVQQRPRLLFRRHPFTGRRPREAGRPRVRPGARARRNPFRKTPRKSPRRPSTTTT